MNKTKEAALYYLALEERDQQSLLSQMESTRSAALLESVEGFMNKFSVTEEIARQMARIFLVSDEEFANNAVDKGKWMSVLSSLDNKDAPKLKAFLQQRLRA